MPSYDLDDQAAIVTGASRGIGQGKELRLSYLRPSSSHLGRHYPDVRHPPLDFLVHIRR